MPIRKINNPLSSTYEMNWIQKIGYWLGRLCSVCSVGLMSLIDRIKGISSSRFSHERNESTSPNTSLSPRKFKRGTLQEDSDNTSEEELISDEPLKYDEDEAILFEEWIAKRQQNQTKKRPTGVRETKKSIPSSSEQKKPIVNRTIPLLKTPKKEEFKIIECGGGGNCQLLCFLEGIKRQYPELLTLPEKNKKEILTHQKLRQMGVDFARDQIQGYGEYYRDIHGLLDSDLKEHNADTILIPLKRKKCKAEKKIDKDLKRQKITEEQANEAKNQLEEIYSKKLERLKTDKCVQNIENFLKLLETDGFDCSSFHLFALSAIFKLPIHVYTDSKITNPEMFNPTRSDLEPICLFHKNFHFKYVRILNTTNP